VWYHIRMALEDRTPREKKIGRREFLQGAGAGAVGMLAGQIIGEGTRSLEAVMEGHALEPNFVKNLGYVGFSQDEIAELENSIKNTVAQRIKEKRGKERPA